MATEQGVVVRPTTRKWTLSLDWWAVITALVLAVLLLTGIIGSVPW